MKTYIIHVSTALEREKHIKTQILDKGLEAQFINEGDIKDLTENILQTYFKGGMCVPQAATSCAYKHLRAYEYMLEQHIELALILEDDIILHQNFEAELKHIQAEIKTTNIQAFFISLEDSDLRFIKKSTRLKNTRLYPQPTGRTAGAYIVDLEAAKRILEKIKTTKCDLPIDWFHNLCASQKSIEIFWAHPTIATQGSLLGSIKSMIDNKPAHIWRILSFRLQRWYKKILYNLR